LFQSYLFSTDQILRSDPLSQIRKVEVSRDSPDKIERATEIETVHERLA
jgi:hypothetical protein